MVFVIIVEIYAGQNSPGFGGAHGPYSNQGDAEDALLAGGYRRSPSVGDWVNSAGDEASVVALTPLGESNPELSV